MKVYKFSNVYVLRDITGIYFAVDITDKRLYQRKKIYSLNRTGFCLLEIVQKLGGVSVCDLTNEFLKLLNIEVDKKTVFNDVKEFCVDASVKGILNEYDK